jgi:hypothetical protein
MFSVKHNLPAFKAAMQQSTKQGTFAMAVALTRTAVDIKQAEQQEIKRVFDRPTQYTINSLFVRGATKTRLDALVWVKDDRAGSGTPATKYLLPEIEGGGRGLKRFERSLQISGYMPKGWHAVPGRFARLDAFGNVSKGQIIQILSQLRVTLTAGFTRNISTDKKKAAAAKRRAGGQYFAVTEQRGRMLPGIYQRRDFGFGSAAPRPVIVFVPTVQYRVRFEFHRVANTVIESRMASNFATAWAAAQASET